MTTRQNFPMELIPVQYSQRNKQEGNIILKFYFKKGTITKFMVDEIDATVYLTKKLLTIITVYFTSIRKNIKFLSGQVTLEMFLKNGNIEKLYFELKQQIRSFK